MGIPQKFVGFHYLLLDSMNLYTAARETSQSLQQELYAVVYWGSQIPMVIQTGAGIAVVLLLVRLVLVLWILLRCCPGGVRCF